MEASVSRAARRRGQTRGEVYGRLRDAIVASPVPDDPEARITASVGVATFPHHAGNAEDLFRAADAAMFSVKRSTKNRVAAAQGRFEGR